MQGRYSPANDSNERAADTSGTGGQHRLYTTKWSSSYGSRCILENACMPGVPPDA